jgi:DNA-binding PucR family transcriptional regulator
MNIRFPKSKISEIETVESGSTITVCYEIDHSILTVYASMVRVTEQGELVVKIEGHDQKKQKRIATRVPARNIEVEYRPVEKDGTPLRSARNQVEAVNLSKTGILLRMNEVIEPNSRLELHLKLPDMHPITCYGRVMRLALQRSGRIEAAIQFENLEELEGSPLSTYCERRIKNEFG